MLLSRKLQLHDDLELRDNQMLCNHAGCKKGMEIPAYGMNPGGSSTDLHPTCVGQCWQESSDVGFDISRSHEKGGRP